MCETFIYLILLKSSTVQPLLYMTSPFSDWRWGNLIKLAVCSENVLFYMVLHQVCITWFYHVQFSVVNQSHFITDNSLSLSLPFLQHSRVKQNKIQNATHVSHFLIYIVFSNFTISFLVCWPLISEFLAEFVAIHSSPFSTILPC